MAQKHSIRIIIVSNICKLGKKWGKNAEKCLIYGVNPVITLDERCKKMYYEHVYQQFPSSLNGGTYE